MSAPLVSVIIPHYNDLANLEHCLMFFRRRPFRRASSRSLSLITTHDAESKKSAGSAVVSRASFRPELRGRAQRAT